MLEVDSTSTLVEGSIGQDDDNPDINPTLAATSGRVLDSTTPLLGTSTQLQRSYNAIQDTRRQNDEALGDATDSARDGTMSYVAASAEAFSRAAGIRLTKIKRAVETESLSFRPSWFHSWKKGSRMLSIDPSSTMSHRPREPLVIFKDLLDLLVAHHVPGPMLFRMQHEFTDRLGHGRTFEAFGISENRFMQSLRINNLDSKRVQDIESIWKSLPKIAVKRAYVDDRGSSNPSASSLPNSKTRAFGQQLFCVEREIKSLCHPELRDHPNIVRLLAWGLCLDTLENTTDMGPRIPLLVMERADYSLADFITTQPWHTTDATMTHLHTKICLDIGKGLEAIHNAGMIHGDVKLQNVLMFKENGTWIARLSDFGLAVNAQPGLTASDDFGYRGTPRWCPPPGSSRYVFGDLYSFDYFAYGLVVWCILLHRTSPPLPTDESIIEDLSSPFSPHNLYQTVISQAKVSRGVLPNRLKLVLRSCLHDDPRLWRRQPWRYLDKNIYPTIGFVTDSTTLPIALKCLSQSLGYRCVYSLESLVDSFSNSCQNAAKTVTRKCVQMTPKMPKRLYTSLHIANTSDKWRIRLTKHVSQRRRVIETSIRSINGLEGVNINPGGVGTVTHSRYYRCQDYTSLFTALESLIEKIPSAETAFMSNQQSHPNLYALVRVRSRLPYCCYRASNWHRNLLSFALQYRCGFDVLAWLCQGEIGYHELVTLDESSLSRFTGRRYSGRDWASQFVLFAEKGCRLDKNISNYGHKSVLRGMFETLRDANEEASPLIRCLARLQRYALDGRKSKNMPPSLRYFLTGKGLPDTLGELPDSEEAEFWTTALHESVELLQYDAVETLVLGGFEVNCLNYRGKTALQELFETDGSVLRGYSGLERDRIIALLQQRPSKIWHPEFLEASSFLHEGVGTGGSSHHHQSLPHLPMGWNEVRIQDDSHASKVNTLYQERHFGSLTFRRPTFSFFSDQRLALGFRRAVVPGQTYYLDLLRFIIEPLNPLDSSKPLNWTYSDRWYAAEAAESDELELYTLKYLITITLSWILTVVTEIADCILQGAIAIHGLASKMIRAFIDILYIASPLFKYLPYALIPPSLLLSGSSVPLTMKVVANIYALAGLCNVIQYTSAYFLCSDGNGYMIALLCNAMIDFAILAFMIQQGLSDAFHGFVFSGAILNAQITVLGISSNYFARDHGTLRLQILAFILFLYLDYGLPSSTLATFMSQGIPMFFLMHWALFLVFIGALLYFKSPFSRFAFQYSRTTDIICFRWLWSGNDDNVGGALWSKDYIPNRARGILSCVLVTCLAFTCLTSSKLVILTSHFDSETRKLLLCVLIPIATRATPLLGVLRENLAPAPLVTRRNIIALSPFSKRAFFSPNASTFFLLTLAYPISYFVAFSKHHPLAFHLPTLDGWCILAVLFGFVNAVYLRMKLGVKRLWLDFFLVHCLAYLGYQAYLSTTLL